MDGGYIKQTWAIVITILVLIIVFNISTLVLMAKQITGAVLQQPPPATTESYRRMVRRSK